MPRPPKRNLEIIASKKISKRKLNPSLDTSHETTPKHTDQIFLGAHVSVSGGIENAVKNAVAIGAKSFACFVRNQRKWHSKELSEESIELFKHELKASSILPSMVVPHGIYLMNCGSPKADILKKSRDTLIDELQRCERLGLTYYNFHPGSTCGEISVMESTQRIADSVNMAHRATKSVKVLLENMSKQGNTIGGEFSELAAIIDKVEDKSRIGVCLDTCHAFAAGWDLSMTDGWENLVKEIERTIGLDAICAIHLNDSKSKCGSHLDRHEDLGKGMIGWEGLLRIICDARLKSMPIILETPGFNSYDQQIKQAYKRLSTIKSNTEP